MQPSITVDLNKHTESKFDLVISPLRPSYGYTLGNSFRRIALASIPGTALTRIRINEITHEYQTVDGVVEDALTVILNLKQIRAIIPDSEEKVVINFTAKKDADITAGDIFKDSKIKVSNPELYICNLNKGHNLEIELEFSRGVGYLSVEEIDLVKNVNPHDIYVDAVFSPILNVEVNVEKVRVGDKTNYDKLFLTIDTDQTVKPESVAGLILDEVVQEFTRIKSSFEAGLGIESVDFQKSDKKSSKVPESTHEEPSDEIDLPVKIKNILSKNGISTNQDLKARVAEVESFPGIAENSLKKINDYLKNI